MPNVIYAKLLQTVSDYVPRAKAEAIVNRQLPKCNSTADTLNKEGLKSITAWVEGAALLYISDDGRKAELSAKLKAMAS